MQLFSSYMYIVKAAETTFEQKIHTFNIDEIDTWFSVHNECSHLPLSLLHAHAHTHTRTHTLTRTQHTRTQHARTHTIHYQVHPLKRCLTHSLSLSLFYFVEIFFLTIRLIFLTRVISAGVIRTIITLWPLWKGGSTAMGIPKFWRRGL